MEVYLVRHGEALGKEEDPARPLSERGQEEICRVGEQVKRLSPEVSGIYHSSKLRAKQTAEILAEYLTPPGGIRERSDLEPLDDPNVMKEELDAASKPLVLVGHLPYLSHLTSLLVIGDPEKEIVQLASGAMIALLKAGDGWKVKWLLVPQLAS